MRPAFSVVFLTTLIGAGQGLFVAVYAAEAFTRAKPAFFVAGSAAALVLAGLGLIASFFHLGRPERAWRSAAMWRTSWLSREVIALPVFMALVAAYGAAHYLRREEALAIGAAGVAAAFALFFCTAMIYACVKFLQEWASGFTIANFVLMGCASGFTLAVALAAFEAPHLVRLYAPAAIALTIAALLVRLLSLQRNDNLRPVSTLQSATGLQGPHVRQISQGFTAGAFNTIEFFHGRSAAAMRRLRFGFIVLAFLAPILLVHLGARTASIALLVAAVLVQYAGLAMERWFFLAQANHPQNLYYQNIA
jgi:DMSO reductase anchor subunit